MIDRMYFTEDFVISLSIGRLSIQRTNHKESKVKMLMDVHWMLLKAPGLIEPISKRVLRDNFKQQFENDSQLCFTFRLSYSLIN